MKILLCGQKRFGRDALSMLVEEGHEIAAVACPPGGEEPDRLFLAASHARHPVIPSGTLAAATMPEGVDVIVCAHSHDFVSRATRLRARHGAIGYHPSLLPRHRGRDAVRWAVHMGDAITGGTVYWLSNTVDGGDIAAQEAVHIRPGDTPLELWARDLAPLGIRLLRQTLREIASGVIRRTPQDPALATWEPSYTGQPRLHRPDLPLLPHNPLP